MKENLFIAFLLSALVLTAQNYEWLPLDSFDGPARTDMVTMSIDNDGYMGTGRSGSTLYDDWWRYDPMIDKWFQQKPVPGSGRWGAVGFEIDGKGYVGAGNKSGDQSSGVFVNDFYVYDPVLDDWDCVQNVGDRGRFAGVGFSINGKGYVVWGNDEPQLSGEYDGDRSVYEFDPTVGSSGAWTQKNDFSGIATEFAAVFVINNKTYLVGGWGYDFDLGYPFGGSSFDTWQYNPATDGWVAKADAPYALYKSAALKLRNSGFLIGGWGNTTSNSNSDQSIPVVIEYKEQNNTWQGNTSGYPFANNLNGANFGFSPCDYLALSGNGQSKELVLLEENSVFPTTGPTLLCTSGQGIYTVSNVPAGASVSWTKSSNLTIISQSGNSLTVQAPSTNGTTAWVRPTITGACGGVELDSHTVWIQNSASMTYAGAGIECLVVEKMYNYTPAIPISSDVIQDVSINTTKLDVYLESGKVYVVNNSVAPGTSQSFIITLTMTDNLGCTITGTRSGVFYQKTPCDCGYDDPSCVGSGGPPMQMIVFPNPTEDEVTIFHKDNNDFEIRVYDFSNNLILRDTSTQGQLEKVLKNLNPGTYIIVMQTKNGERYQTRVVKN